jgi:hypothetical protein
VPSVLKSGSSTSRNPQGLSRPVMGLLYHDVHTASDSHPASYLVRICPLKYINAGAELCVMLR